VANDSDVSKRRASDGVQLGRFLVGGNPRGVAFDGAHIWVANANDDTVSKH
jgi:DNA-binding beta-propeller fold protein YncE